MQAEWLSGLSASQWLAVYGDASQVLNEGRQDIC